MGRWFLLISVPMVLIYFSYSRNIEMRRWNGSKEYVFWVMAVVYLVLFAGLRLRYNDTVTYLNTFKKTQEITIYLKTTKFSIDNYWGYGFLKSVLKTIGMDNHLILLTFTAFYTTVHLWFFRKYAEDYLPLTMFIFICDGYMMLLAALKQVSAVAFALIAIDALLHNKKIKYLVFMFIAITFHPYVAVLLVVPLILGKKPWTGYTWILVGVMVILGLEMQFTAGVLEQINDTYDASSILDHTMNPIRFFVSLVPLLISYTYRKILFKDSNVAENLFAHLTICRTMFYFWALFGNPIVFARVSNYFDFSNAIFLGWAINKLCVKNETAETGEILKYGMFIGFILFSYILNIRGYDFIRQTEHISAGQLFSSVSNWLGAF